MMNPLPSLSRMHFLLAQEERQRQVKIGNHFQSEGTSFSAITGGSNTRYPGPRKPDNRRSMLFCDHCKRNGHTIDKRYKIHGYPGANNGDTSKGAGRNPNHNKQNYKGAHNAWGEAESQATDPTFAIIPSLNQEQSKQLIQFISNLTSNTDSRNLDASASATPMAGICYALNAVHSFCTFSQDNRILDSGASGHMSSKQNILHDLTPLVHPIMVNLLNGARVKVTHMGKLKISSGLVLNNVLLVPYFKFNLLSIKKL